MSSQPPSGFIHLVLLSQEAPFYLEIPIAIVATVCLSPRKYLRYLGWCVLGVVGVLTDEQENEIVLDGELLDQGVYRYLVPDQNVLAHAVDLEVIKQRSQVPSESTRTREDFCTKVLKRDGCCVWTGGDGVGMHIIPYARGDEWLQRIIDNRPHAENLKSLSSINDIRNGICAEDTIHNRYFDPRKVVILKTPNPMLETADVPDRCQRNIDTNLMIRYPTNSRYTFQWIVTPRTIILDRFPNNNDATFKNQRLSKPADLLLHYNYGAAAVKQWGKNVSVLTNRPGIPRPSVPVPAPMGPSRITHDHTSAIQKRAAAMSQGGQGAGNERSTSEGAAADCEAQDGWDEDDVMLFFWGNSKAALDRHAQKKQERTEYLEDWRAGVT